MKSGTNAVGLWIDGGLTAMIFSFYGVIPGSVDSVTVVLYFVFRYLVSVNRRALRVILAVFMIFVIMEGIYGFCQLYGWLNPGHALFRLTGSFFNPGPYACFLSVGLCVALSRLLNYRKIKYFWADNIARVSFSCGLNGCWYGCV